jgi:hypothetical protein
LLKFCQHESNFLKLLERQQKHEITWKSSKVACHLLVQSSGRGFAWAIHIGIAWSELCTRSR